MYAVPDVEEVMAIAKELGIHLGAEEAVLYRTYLMEQMREFDTFVQARLEEARPPMAAIARATRKRTIYHIANPFIVLDNEYWLTPRSLATVSSIF